MKQGQCQRASHGPGARDVPELLSLHCSCIRNLLRCRWPQAAPGVQIQDSGRSWAKHSVPAESHWSGAGGGLCLVKAEVLGQPSQAAAARHLHRAGFRFAAV